MNARLLLLFASLIAFLGSGAGEAAGFKVGALHPDSTDCLSQGPPSSPAHWHGRQSTGRAKYRAENWERSSGWSDGRSFDRLCYWLPSGRSDSRWIDVRRAVCRSSRSVLDSGGGSRCAHCFDVQGLWSDVRAGDSIRRPGHGAIDEAPRRVSRPAGSLRFDATANSGLHGSGVWVVARRVQQSGVGAGGPALYFRTAGTWRAGTMVSDSRSHGLRCHHNAARSGCERSGRRSGSAGRGGFEFDSFGGRNKPVDRGIRYPGLGFGSAGRFASGGGPTRMRLLCI